MPENDSFIKADAENHARIESENLIYSLNSRLDILIHKIAPKKKAWYRDAGVFISVCAFVISVITSTIAAFRTYQQDINSRKDALHAIIIEYSTVQFRNIGLQYEYEKYVPPLLNGSGKAINIINYETYTSGILRAETAALSKQAYSLVKELGRNASSIDFTEAAVILGANIQFPQSEELYVLGVNSAENSLEYVAALRGLGQTQYAEGKRVESMKTLDKALNVFEKFQNESGNIDLVNSTMANTYNYWASFIGKNECGVSYRLAEKSKEILSKMPDYFEMPLRIQVDKEEFELVSCK